MKLETIGLPVLSSLPQFQRKGNCGIKFGNLFVKKLSKKSIPRSQTGHLFETGVKLATVYGSRTVSRKNEVKTMAQAFFGGVHPNDMKAATSGKAIEQLAPPKQVIIPMSQHIGKPCTPTVKVGDHVKVGQKIGEPGGFVSAPIHASVSGTVTAVEPRPYSMGGDMMSVVIENDFQDTLSEEIQAPENVEALTPDEMVEIVKNAGIVGMGGATFPTFIKISGGIGKVDTVIVNGAECEPYITADHRTMLERPDELIGGATLLAKMFGLDKVHIAIETNKMDAINLLTEKVKEAKAPIVVNPLRTRYPQGSEKQMCQAITGRQVPPGKLCPPKSAAPCST
jgi:electron transport complex protein RnfC